MFPEVSFVKLGTNNDGRYKPMMILVGFLVVYLYLCSIGAVLATNRWLQPKFLSFSSSSYDKSAVQAYFGGEGFRRWSTIYSESPDVNKVQRDVRRGHQQTIDKVLRWLRSVDTSNSTLCDAGCGVGSLSLPAASMFKRVVAYDISEPMIRETKRRCGVRVIKNVECSVADIENLTGSFDTVACIDVVIHYPTNKMYDIVSKLGSIAKDRVILTFAPKTPYHQALKKVGELFPGRSKVTRAYLHSEKDVRKALSLAGFEVRRHDMTGTKFYFSRLFEAVRREKP